jgi:hypothetical protein
MKWEIRPLGTWTDPETKARRATGVFRATWQDTLNLLADEIGKIGGKDPVIFQVDVADADIRLDGMLRAGAQVGHPGVIVSFDSDFGPLRYATDAYEKQWGGQKVLASWQGNLRAIALTLGALRAIDRWGVSKRGEQYTGWKALPAPGTGPSFPSADDALEWMRDNAVEMGFMDPEPERVYRFLARRWHPDVSTSTDNWGLLAVARRMLIAAGVVPQ